MATNELIDVVKLLGEFAVFPLIAVLWRLNNSVKDLEIIMNEKFLSKEEFREWRDEWKSARNLGSRGSHEHA